MCAHRLSKKKQKGYFHAHAHLIFLKSAKIVTN